MIPKKPQPTPIPFRKVEPPKVTKKKCNCAKNNINKK